MKYVGSNPDMAQESFLICTIVNIDINIGALANDVTTKMLGKVRTHSVIYVQDSLVIPLRISNLGRALKILLI